MQYVTARPGDTQGCLSPEEAAVLGLHSVLNYIVVAFATHPIWSREITLELQIFYNIMVPICGLTRFCINMWLFNDS